MATDLFDLAAERLEHHTDFNRLEARGTLRITLKDAGLKAKNLTLQQLEVVLEKLMPVELERRRVEDAVAICNIVMGEVARVAGTGDTASSSSADEVFRRLGDV
jgi:hypothetical protein